MKKNKLLCLILTMLMSLALMAGGSAIISVADATERSVSSAAGETVTVAQSAENVTAWTLASDNNRYKLYNYTGGIQSVVLPKGRYKFEAWGASGGNDGNQGGHGGYVAQTYDVSADTTIYIVVGGVGASSYSGVGGQGYNGGGATGASGSSGGGGGATHFATASGTLNSLKTNKAAVLIVGGGGGGAGNTNNPNNSGYGGITPQANNAGSAPTQTDTYFGQGGNCTGTDGGGGGGGYYGGLGATTDCYGGGGKSYINASNVGNLTVVSGGSANANGNASMPNPTSYGANYTKGTGTGQLNGYARIISLNSPPVAKTGVAYTVARTATQAIPVTALASDTVPSTDSVSYLSATPQIYTNSACTTEATAYFDYVSRSTTSITLHPKKVFANTTFYTKVTDTFGAQTVVSFTWNASAYTVPTKTADGLKGSSSGIYGTAVKTGTNYPALSDTTVSSSASWNTAQDIYNPTATGRLTYMITRPLETATSSRWNGLTSATISVADLAQTSDKYSNALLDDVYITTYSASGNGTNYNISAAGSSSKWTSLTITPTVSSATGWFVVPITIGMYEKASGVELTTTAQRISVDIVFRIGNERPTVKDFKSIVLDTTTNKTATVSLSDIVTDRNGNTLELFRSSNMIDRVKVPESEYVYVNKYGTMQTAANYNVGFASSSAASYVDNPFSSTATGFQTTSIYNSALTNAANVLKEAYVSYTINGTSIEFTAIRASRSQYSATRTAAGLGHFYIVVHVTDTGDTRDTGIWYPIAITVNDTSAPTVRSYDFTFDAPEVVEGMTSSDVTAAEAAADFRIISPYYLSTNDGRGIGAVDPLDYDDFGSYTEYAFGSDISEYGFGFDSAGDPNDGLEIPFMFNDFLYINGDFGNISEASDYYGTYSDYMGYRYYLNATAVKLYAPASFFARLTPEQKTAAGLQTLTDAQKTAAGFADPSNHDIVSFNGVRISPRRSTVEKWIEVPVRLTDIFGHATETTVAVKVNNRESVVREEVNLQGIARQRTDSGHKTVTYIIHNTSAEAFTITPYDLVFDADLYSYPTVDNSNPNASNSNTSNSGFTTVEEAIYKTSHKVYARDTADGASQKTELGHDTLSFVADSLPFNPSVDAEKITYTQSRYNNELTLGYVRNANKVDYITVSPKMRNTADNAYTLSDIRITDKSGSVVSVDIEIRVVNSLPRLIDASKVLYLTTDFMGQTTNNSAIGVEDYPGAGGLNDNSHFTDTGYNVREFAINEMVTDLDPSDIASLEIVSRPVVGTIIDGRFEEMPDASEYITVDYNVMGSGSRSSYVVTRITAKSSTQALKTGLFVQIEVTDKFNRAYYGNLLDTDAVNFNNEGECLYLANTLKLCFQVEVLNSAPVFNTNGQFEAEEGTRGVFNWSTQPINMNDTLAARYIAPDEKTAKILTDIGFYIEDENGDAVLDRELKDNVRYFLYDYDGRQKLMPYTVDASLLPRAVYSSSSTSVWENDAAVRFTNPYGLIDDKQVDEATLADTVKIVWFAEENGSYYRVDLESLLKAAQEDGEDDPTPHDTDPDTEDPEPTDPYELIVPHTGKTLAECLESDVLYWAVGIFPQAEFESKGIDIYVRFRDSSPEGGCTQTVIDPDTNLAVPRDRAYKGVRGEDGKRVILETFGNASFNLKIGALGITRNTVAFSNADVAADNNKYFAYHIEGISPNTEYTAIYPDEVFTDVDPFYYNPVTLANDKNNKGGSEDTAYIPLSYLAVPQGIGDIMQQTVDFDTSYWLDTVGNDARPRYRKDEDITRNMLMSMSLYDPATGCIWSGTDILNNPYFSIVYTESSELENSPYLNKNLYYSSSDGIARRNRENKGGTGNANPLREDRFGFALTKKSVRTNGFLELTVTLGAFQYTTGDSSTDTTVGGAQATRVTVKDADGKDTVSRETVTLLISVPNDNIVLTAPSAELSTESLRKDNPSSTAQFAIGRPDTIISLVNDETAIKALARSDYRLLSEYDNYDYLTAPYEYTIAGEPFHERTFKETAYFFSPSIRGNFTPEYLAHIFESEELPGGTYRLVNTFIDESDSKYTAAAVNARLAAYFGVNTTLIENAIAHSAGATEALLAAADVNYRYENFFTVSPIGRDDTSLSFHAVRRISVDFDTAWAYYTSGNPSASESVDADRLAAVEAYMASKDDLKGLKARIGSDGKIEVYFPFRIMVYDDYAESGFTDGSFAILELDILITNTEPYANTAMVTATKPSGAALTGDYYYDLEIAKGESYAMRVSDFFGDNNMVMNSTIRSYYSKAEIENRENVLELNTSDFFKYDTGHGCDELGLGFDVDTLTLEEVTTNTDVAIDFTGFYKNEMPYEYDTTKRVLENTSHSGDTDTVRGQIRFTAINRTRNNIPVEFKITFTDGVGKVSVVFRVTVTNQAPTTLVTPGFFGLPELVTMRTGEVFTVLVTSWDRYISGVREVYSSVDPTASDVDTSEFGDDFYGTINDTLKRDLNDRYSINGAIDDYRQFSERQLPSNLTNGSTGAFMTFEFSDVSSTNKNGAEYDYTQFIDNSTEVPTTYGYYDVNGNRVDTGSLGFLCLADDDLPWGLKFSNAGNPIGIETKAISYQPLNLVNNNLYALAFQFKANSSCNDVPVNLTAYDAEGKSIRFTFRITVQNTPPYLVGEVPENNDFSAYGMRYNDNAEETTEPRYEMTMKVGQSVNLPTTFFVRDADANDSNNLRTQRSFGGSAFSIDGVLGTTANNYFTFEDRTSSVQITCNNAYLGNRPYTDLIFRVVDSVGDMPVPVRLRIYTEYSGISDARNSQSVSVESAQSYADTRTPTVKQLVNKIGNYAVYDEDFGSRTNYDVAVYTLFDYDYATDKITIKERGEDYDYTADGTNCVLRFNSSTGSLAEADTNLYAMAKLDLIKRYFEMSFSADGSQVFFTPRGATLNVPALPLYFEVTKVVSGDSADRQENTDTVAGLSCEISVGDSAPAATVNSVANNNSFPPTGGEVDPSPSFLTVRGTVGYEQVYTLWNRTNSDFGLFYDRDSDDSLTFVGAEVVSTEEHPVPDGWQADDELGLSQAFDISVSGNALTARIVRKVVNPDNKVDAFTIPVRVTVSDKSGATASTVITFEIHNSTPSFEPAPTTEDRNYELVYDAVAGEYVLDFTLEGGTRRTVNLADFVSDLDTREQGERYSIITANFSDTSLERLSYVGENSYNEVVYVAAGEDEQAFAVRLAAGDNLSFIVDALSYERDAVGSVLYKLRDSSFAETAIPVRIRFTIANSAPTLLPDAPTELILLGGSGVSGEVLYDSEQIINVMDFVTDVNPADIGREGSETFIRAYRWDMGSIVSNGEALDPVEGNHLFNIYLPTDDNPYRQKLAIAPIAGKYGRQTLLIEVSDDGGHAGNGSYIQSFLVTVTVARNPDAVTLNNLSVHYKRGISVTLDDLVPYEYSLGYEITGIRQSVEFPEKTVLVSGTGGNYYITAEKADTEVTNPVKMFADVKVGNETRQLPFYVTILANNAPEYLIGDDGMHKTAYNFELDSLDVHNSIRLTPEQLYIDPEGDTMSFLEVSSSQTFRVEVEIDSATNTLVITFHSSGTSELDIYITDATGARYRRPITVTNTTLPELNFFLRLAQSFVLRPWLYIILIIAIILLVLLLILIFDIRRRKKREQAEVEALLVSEMQLEEQMMKLAGTQNPELPPSQLDIGVPPPTGLPGGVDDDSFDDGSI